MRRPSDDASAAGSAFSEPAVITEFAPAKINLTLEIAGRRADGYHELVSVVAFSRCAACDVLTFEPGLEFSLTVEGPEAAHLEGENLICLAARQLAAAYPGLMLGRFHLTKNLPVASGIGGGSSDAAAAIRAIARANMLDVGALEIQSIAKQIGADVPVCLGEAGGPPLGAIMSGIGERVWRPNDHPLLPDGLAAVLVNPRKPVSTGAVFQRLQAPLIEHAPKQAPPQAFESIDACLDHVRASRNDLEAPAVAIEPLIEEVLVSLRELPACRLARMSGSGGTCFALFDSLSNASAAATTLSADRPDWWGRATALV